MACFDPDFTIARRARAGRHGPTICLASYLSGFLQNQFRWCARRWGAAASAGSSGGSGRAPRLLLDARQLRVGEVLRERRGEVGAQTGGQAPRFRPLRAVCKLLGGKLIIQKLINRFCTHRNTIKHLTVTRGGGPGRPPFWRTLISPGVLKNKP